MTYFDNAATTHFKPEPVINAVKNSMQFLSANPGRSGHTLSIRCAQLVHKTRQKTAAFLGLARGDIMFTLNCTQALNYAISGVFGKALKPAHAICTAYEHNSVLRPLHELARAGKISLTVVPPDSSGAVNPGDLLKAIRGDTKLVVTNHISNVTGAVTPVKEIGRICRSYKILYLVDGAQSVGLGDISMDEDFIDLIAFAPHKGLHAPQGLGVLAVRAGIALSPVIFGGTGTDSANVFQPEELPESLESGTLPTPAIAGLNAALTWTKNTMKDSAIKIASLSDHLLSRLKEIGGVKLYTAPNSLNGIVSFNIKDYHSADVADILSSQYDICVRGGLHCAPLIHKHLGTLDQGIVRASLGSDNTYPQTDFLIKAVREIAGA